MAQLQQLTVTDDGQPIAVFNQSLFIKQLNHQKQLKWRKKDLVWSAFRRTAGGRDSAIWLAIIEVEPWPPLFFPISMWKGWRPAEHSWLWEDSGPIPLHAHANHPQQPQQRLGQMERSQCSDLPVRPWKTGTLLGYGVLPRSPSDNNLHPSWMFPFLHEQGMILLSSFDNEGCNHYDIT